MGAVTSGSTNVFFVSALLFALFALFAGLVMLAFSERPDAITLLGCAIIVGSGIYILFSNHRGEAEMAGKVAV